MRKDDQIPLPQQAFCRVQGMVGQEIKEAFIHHQQGAARRAAVEDLLHQRQGRQLAGGIVGLAEEHHVHPRTDGRTERIRDRKVLLLPQKEAFHRAADTFQSSGILCKGGCGDQRPAGLFCPDQPEDEVCRPIAAEDLLRRHALMERQLCPQFPAQGVGVAVGRGQCRRDGPGHPFRQAQRADVGRKIQRIPPELGPVTGPIAAMY